MDSPRSRPSGGADGLVLYRRARSSQRSVQSSEWNELPASQPAQPEASRMSGKGAKSKEQVRVPSAGIECSDGICESTTGTCIRGHDAEDMSACTTRLKKPIHIPPSWIGGITSRTLMSTAWRTMTRSSGRSTLRDAVGIVAGTRARERENHRDRRPPSAFLTPKAPRLTGTPH